jgi:pimeloyl-ACP methyl ester carboxylesterase
MEFVETSGGRLAYDERGDGTPVVLLASGAHDRHDYDLLRERLPAGLRTIALDWPAHGDSPPATVAPSAMAFADLAAEAVAALAPEGAVVVGCSLGGYGAARMALRRPELVRGLVLIDSGGFAPSPPQARAFCALMGRPWLLRRIYPAFSRAYLRDGAPPAAEVRRRAIATTRRADGAAAVSGVWRSFPDPEHDLRAAAPSIAVPTLVVWGRRDPVIPVAVGRRRAEALPDAELLELDTGHLPHVSDPDAVAGAVTRLLARVAGVAAGAEDAGVARGAQPADPLE